MTEPFSDREILDLLVRKDGEMHCPVSFCSKRYPRGMHYMFLKHYRSHNICLECEQNTVACSEALCSDCVE